MIDSHKYPTVLASIVIPVYNQERNVSRAISKVKETLVSSGLSDYEIVVVDDGSTDDTLQVLQKERSVDQHITVVSYTPNRGKGFAVKRGILHSHGKVAMFFDGDLNISTRMIRDYLTNSRKTNLIIASKRHPQSKVDVPTSRRFLSRIFNLIVQVCVGICVHDTQAGLKAGDGDLLRTIFSRMRVNRYAFDVELLTIASILKLDVQEMPVDLKIDRKFKLKDIARMLIDVMKISYRYRVAHSYQKEFMMTEAHVEEHRRELVHHASAEA
jgi:dolichol-phosphate mannosyltransferase